MQNEFESRRGLVTVRQFTKRAVIDALIASLPYVWPEQYTRPMVRNPLTLLLL